MTTNTLTETYGYTAAPVGGGALVSVLAGGSVGDDAEATGDANATVTNAGTISDDARAYSGRVMDTQRSDSFGVVSVTDADVETPSVTLTVTETSTETTAYAGGAALVTNAAGATIGDLASASGAVSATVNNAGTIGSKSPGGTNVYVTSSSDQIVGTFTQTSVMTAFSSPTASSSSFLYTQTGSGQTSGGTASFVNSGRVEGSVEMLAVGDVTIVNTGKGVGGGVRGDPRRRLAGAGAVSGGGG